MNECRKVGGLCTTSNFLVDSATPSWPEMELMLLLLLCRCCCLLAAAAASGGNVVFPSFFLFLRFARIDRPPPFSSLFLGRHRIVDSFVSFFFIFFFYSPSLSLYQCMHLSFSFIFLRPLSCVTLFIQSSSSLATLLSFQSSVFPNQYQ